MILITYLPFYRIHEVTEYFLKNVEVLRPRQAIAYIDNVYHSKQREFISKVVPDNVEVRLGNWRNRNDTWLTILSDLHTMSGDDALVVDSDNVVDPALVEIHTVLRTSPIYTVLDWEAWGSGYPRQFMVRSRRVGYVELGSGARPIYAYRVFDVGNVFRSGSLFFIGPKQVVSIMKPPDVELINRVRQALSSVDPWLRNFISDETLLGILAHLMGIEEVPWTVASHHHYHASAPGTAPKHLVALAHRQFAKALYGVFRRREFLAYYIKYSMAFLKNALPVFLQ